MNTKVVQMIPLSKELCWNQWRTLINLIVPSEIQSFPFQLAYMIDLKEYHRKLLTYTNNFGRFPEQVDAKLQWTTRTTMKLADKMIYFRNVALYYNDDFVELHTKDMLDPVLSDWKKPL